MHPRTRRGLAGGALLLAGACRAAAQPTPVTPQEAEYQATPKGVAMCASCTLFIRPDRCKVVIGPVAPEGWCRLYDMVD